MDAGQASYVNTRQQMLDTNFDEPQYNQSNQFEIATDYQNDTYQAQSNVPLTNLNPIQQDPIKTYMENVWDNTEISPQEYMNG